MGDIVYVNVELNQSSGEYRQPLRGEVSRTSAIIDRVGDYYCAIARLTAPLNLPLWLPEMQLGAGSAANYANTIYHVSLNYTQTGVNEFYTAPLRIIRAEGNYTVQPNDLSNAIYTKQAIAEMFNSAFALAFEKMTTAQVDLKGVTAAPKFVYNQDNDCFDIYLWQANYYTTYEGPDKKNIAIFFSASLNNYLAGFNVNVRNFKAGNSDPAKYDDILLNVDGCSIIEGASRQVANSFVPNPADPTTVINFTTLNKPTAATPYIAQYDNGADGDKKITPFDIYNTKTYELTEMGGLGGAFGAIAVIPNTVKNSATDRFNAVNCVRVISSGLCQNEELSATILPGGRVSTSPSSSSISVLQDFIPDRTPGWSQQMLLYTADSVITGARYVDMSGNNSLIHFSISLEWLDVWGVSRPLYSLSNSNNSSVKLAFVSKSLFRK